MSPPARLLSSPLFLVKETVRSGRGVYATQPIVAGTLLLETPELAASVVYREYRKEVCVQCFAYDRGRAWKIRNATNGSAFCSEACLGAFQESNEGLVAAALVAIEALGKTNKQDVTDAEECQDERRPTVQDVTAAWQQAELVATHIRAARSSGQPSKAQRRVLSQVLALQPLRDIISFLLSGVLCAAIAPALWAEVLELATEEAPYTSQRELDFHVTSYHQLLACCPMELLPHVQAETIQQMARKGAHNIFSIWSQDLGFQDSSKADSGSSAGGSECLGYGLWTAASYWNHSCAPNVRKRRAGRSWHFCAERDIEEGEELCITYLGGDERYLCRAERMARLQEHWGFECACARCGDRTG